jgi:TolA-binding protein
MGATISTRAAAALLALALAGCGGSSADALLETAELEEVQNNPAHARELYEEVVRHHPGTPQAERAAARLRALGQGK